MVLRLFFFFILTITFSLASMAKEFSASEKKQIYQRFQEMLSLAKKSSNKAEILKQMKELTSTIEDISSDVLDFDKLLDEYDKIQEEYAKSIFKLSYELHFSLISWNYLLTLERDGASDVGLISKEEGVCIGGGVKYQNSYWGAELSACYAALNATIGTEDSIEVSFNQHDVDVDAALVKMIAFLRVKEDTSLKFGLPVIYRSSEYGSVSNASVKDDRSFSYGYSLGAEWRIQSYLLGTTIGSLEGFSSSYWDLSIGYTF